MLPHPTSGNEKDQAGAGGQPAPRNPSPFAEAAAADKFFTTAPSLSLPQGGGAIRGMGEEFAADPVTGTGSMTVPIAASPGRGGFGPPLSLS